jgi:hypothetical protein
VNRVSFAFLLGMAFLVAVAACTAIRPASNYRALTKQAVSLGAACDQAVAHFAAEPGEEVRREVLARLKALNAALIETAGYEREARRLNSVDLIDANRAFLETGRAWANCSLQYNRVLAAIGERETARYNYQGVLARLTAPQFVAERRLVQAALNELDR